MQTPPADLDRALQHAAAQAGLDAKPAARGHRPLVLQGERKIEHITRAIAQPQVGAHGLCERHERSDRKEALPGDATARSGRAPRGIPQSLEGDEPANHEIDE